MRKMHDELPSLKPCPICGGDPIVHDPPYANDYASIECGDCGANTNSYMKDLYNEGLRRAVTDWNNNKVFPYEN